MNIFLAGFSHLQSLCSWLVPNEFYSMLGRTGHQLIQIVFLHRGNCMLFYFWRGENEKTAFAPLFFLSLHHLPVSSQQSLYRSSLRDILMKQKMLFGLVLGRLAIWKKSFGLIMSNFWGQFFHISKGKGVCTEKLHIISFFKKRKRNSFFLPLEIWKNCRQIDLTFTIDCVLLYWRHIPPLLLHNDFGSQFSLLQTVQDHLTKYTHNLRLMRLLDF